MRSGGSCIPGAGRVIAAAVLLMAVKAKSAPPEPVFQPFDIPKHDALTSEALEVQTGSLPAHRAVRLRLCVAIEGSWDGTTPGDGPDTLAVRLEDGRTVWNTSFAAEFAVGDPGNRQGFPDRVPGFDHPGGTGIATNGAYVLECVIPHHADRLQVLMQADLNEFLSENRNNPENESWRLWSAEYALIVEPPAQLDDTAFRALWKALGADDPAAGWAAVDGLLSVDPQEVLPRLQAEWNGQAGSDGRGPDRQAHLAERVARLDGGDWRERAAASKELAELPLADLAILKSLRVDSLSLEARLELEDIIRKIGACATSATEESRRWLRLRYVLQMMEIPAARELLAALPEAGAD